MYEAMPLMWISDKHSPTSDSSSPTVPSTCADTHPTRFPGTPRTPTIPPREALGPQCRALSKHLRLLCWEHIHWDLTWFEVNQLLDCKAHDRMCMQPEVILLSETLVKPVRGKVTWTQPPPRAQVLGINTGSDRCEQAAWPELQVVPQLWQVAARRRIALLNCGIFERNLLFTSSCLPFLKLNLVSCNWLWVPGGFV